MNFSEYQSKEETSVAIYNGKLYKAIRKYKTLLYLTDYYSRIIEFRYDITIDDTESVLKILNTFHNLDIQQSLYNDYTNHIIWLKPDIDYETICKIHSHLLYITYQNSLTLDYSKEAILAREILYISNILEAYNNIHNRISSTLYEAVNNGVSYITLNYTLSAYALTQQCSTKIKFPIKTSEDTFIYSFDAYIAYLLRSTLVKHGFPYEEGVGKELIELMLEKQLKEKFPHLIIYKKENYVFEIHFMKENELML